MTLEGIDLSNHQGPVDWRMIVEAGKVFAFAKASEGISFLDPYFTRNWRGMKEAGIVRGAYHYGRPNSNQAAAEVDLFLRVIDGAGGLAEGDLLCLDIEDTLVSDNQDLRDWVMTWLHDLEEKVGFKPLIYSGLWYLEPHKLIGSVDLGRHGLWLAAYQQFEPLPPPGWDVIAFWQYTDRGRVPGVTGFCDLDWFNGDRDQLALYGYHAKPAVVTEPGPEPAIPPPSAGPVLPDRQEVDMLLTEARGYMANVLLLTSDEGRQWLRAAGERIVRAGQLLDQILPERED